MKSLESASSTCPHTAPISSSKVNVAARAGVRVKGLDDEVPGVGQLHVPPHSAHLLVQGERGLIPIFRGEGEAVVARLVEEGQGGVVENQGVVVEAVQVDVDKGARDHSVLVAHLRQDNIALVFDRSEELSRGERGQEDQEEHGG